MAGLDLLRALAVFLVLGRHSLANYDDLPSIVATPLEIWRRGGWVGVDLFFVLSGFLVSGLLFSEIAKSRKISVGRFLARRALKIYPAFYFFLACSVPILLILKPHLVLARPLLGELLFFQNYVGQLWNHTWSLAVEEHFYLLIPIMVMLLSRHSSRVPLKGVAWLSILIAAGCFTQRLLLAATSRFDPTTHLYFTHLRIDSLMYGVLLSAIYHARPDQTRAFVGRYRSLLCCVGMALFVPAFLFKLETTPFLWTFGLTLFYLGGGCLVLVAAVCSPLTPSRPVRGIAYLGSHSYSIYLWHMPVAWAMAILPMKILHQPLPSIISLVAYVLLAVAIGVTAALLIEFPVLRIRDRLLPSRVNATRHQPFTAPLVSPAIKSF